MPRKVALLLVLVPVVLAGCAGTQPTGTASTASSPNDGAGIEPDQVPGISDGRLTDAATLAQANDQAIAETGAKVRLRVSGADPDNAVRYTYTRDSNNTRMLTTKPVPEQTVTVDYYSNGTETYLRTQQGNRTRYRALSESPRTQQELTRSLTTYLAAGEFTVTEPEPNRTTVTLTADSFEQLGGDVALDGASSLSARLVVTETGQVRNLTVTGQNNGETVAFRYELVRSPVQRVGRPAWVAAVPPNAGLQADISVDVEDGSHLRVEHTGGDAVPAGASLAVSTNNTTDTVTLPTALTAGDTRYAYFETPGSLVVGDEPPAANETIPLESPASVTLTTADGVTVTAGGIAWDSAAAGEDEGESQGRGTGSGSSDPA